MIVSIILTVYNREKYLREAIDSILGQSLEEFELIIIDDGSTDSSIQIIKSYSDLRIRLLVNEQNRGQSYSRNWGIKESVGEYIAIMDSDDIMYPYRLEKQLNFLEVNNAVICFSWADTIDENGNFVTLKKHISDPLLISAKLLFECPLIHPTAMWKKSEFEKHNLWYDEEFVYAQDMELWNRVKENFDIYIIEESLIKFRFGNSNSISFQKKELQYSFAQLITRRELLKLPYTGDIPSSTKSLIKRLILVRKVYRLVIKNIGKNVRVTQYFRDMLFPQEFKFFSYTIGKKAKSLLIN